MAAGIVAYEAPFLNEDTPPPAVDPADRIRELVSTWWPATLARTPCPVTDSKLEARHGDRPPRRPGDGGRGQGVLGVSLGRGNQPPQRMVAQAERLAHERRNGTIALLDDIRAVRL